MTGCVVTVLIIKESICAGDNNLLVAQFLSTSVFLVGVATLLQTTLGMRYVLSSNVTSTQESLRYIVNYGYNLQLNDLQQKKNFTVTLGATKMEGLKCHIFSCHNRKTFQEV